MKDVKVLIQLNKFVDNANVVVVVVVVVFLFDFDVVAVDAHA